MLLALLLLAARGVAADADTDTDTAQPSLPILRFEASPALAPVAARLGKLEPARLARVMTLVGLEHPGPPIRVVLAEEGSPPARRVPAWMAGYAIGPIGLVVLMPARSPWYPDRTLESVLLHEIAHVLVARAAGRRPVARWFNEGVAMAAAPYGLGDRLQLVLASMRRGHPSLISLERAFPVGPDASGRAYALSGAVVRWLLDRYGDRAVARILARVNDGASFAEAFAAVTGEPLAAVEARFWHSVAGWRRLLPLATSPALHWLSITALFLLACALRRRRNTRQRQRWALQEAAPGAVEENETWRVEAPPGGWLH